MPEKSIKEYVAADKASVAHQPPNQTKLINMKSIILVALALVAVASALPVPESITNIDYFFDKDPEGNYGFGYRNDDGTSRNEKGNLKQVPDEENKPQNVIVVEGSFTYIGEDGQPETINYIADENGYRAVGKSIPQAARR